MTNTRVLFPAASAFVIQFATPYTPGNPRAGRVEHVISGRARRFRDETQLMAFVAEVLGSLDVDAAAPANLKP